MENNSTPDTAAAFERDTIKGLSDFDTKPSIAVMDELRRLAEFIRRAKHDIAAIQPKAITNEHIPGASDELDAVVGATEDASNKIMDVCDDIARIAEEAPPQYRDQLIACTTKIFEACNFQDITGQRITKVVATLKHIDDKVGALLRVLGDELHPATVSADNFVELSVKDVCAALLEGPQLPGRGMDQAEADRLMEE